MELFTNLVHGFLSKSVEYVLSGSHMTTLESLQNNVRLLCSKASDVEHAIKQAELSGTKKRKREVREWLRQVEAIEDELQTYLNGLQRERRFIFGGGEVAKLNAKVQELIEQTQDFGALVVDGCDAKGEEFLTKAIVGKKFDENLNKIWNFLVTEKGSSIGIYGMGSAGKTTLAQHINNRLVKQSQEHVVWVTVSQEFSVRMLQDKMAKELHLDLPAEYDEDRRATRLNRALTMKENLVIIFDDVWKEFDLVKLGDPLSVDGCRLLITSRSEAVCHQLHCKQLIKVEKLKKAEAWKLFKETLGQATILNGEMQNIAKSMVDECHGLPLGIITLAASMRGESSINVWRDALEKLREQDLEENVFKVLKHSFDWLGQCEGKSDGYSESQLCFLYCSLYPEGKLIRREPLIRKFILEGFLSKTSRKAMFVRGHAILDKLVNAGLLERSIYGDNDYVKMHDLIRDMAVKITNGIHYCYLSDKFLIDEEMSKDIKRMYWDVRMEEIPSEMSLNFPKLITLFVSNRDSTLLTLIPDSFFLQMCCLCILDLSESGIKKLPDSLSGLVKLKGLLLGWCEELEYVPYLGNLKKLRELDLEMTKIQELPEGVDELSNLRFLSLYQCWKLNMFPKHLVPKWPYLQCLFLSEHIEAPVEEIEKLKHLQEICGKVKHASEFNRLCGRHNLSYNITVGSTFYYAHQGYNQLTLSQYDLKDVVILVNGIGHLCLRECKGLSNCLVESLLQQLNINPTSLKTLYIEGCEEIEWVWRIDRSGATSTSTSASPLPLPPAPPPLVFFSALTVLTIMNCRNMKKLGLPASHVINLEELRIEGCEMIEEIMEVSEKDIGGGESRKSSVVSLPKLRHLILHSLPRLQSLCNALIICHSIKEIELRKCTALKKLPLVFGYPNCNSPPLALDRVNLHEEDKKWWDNLELGHDTGTIRSFLQPFLYFGQEVMSGNWPKAELDEEVPDVIDEGRHFEELLDDVYGIKRDVFSTNQLVGEECLENLENILKFLLDDKVSSVGIYGMDGVGKTKLANRIQYLLQCNQKSVFWIKVSQEFTIATLQDEIAKLIGLEFSMQPDEYLRALRLREELSKRENLVFILDDVWEYLDMKKLGDPLCGNGCKLLITTRSKEVCDQFQCERVIEVKTLKENDAWNLFNETIQMSLTCEVNEIAKHMVNLCNGWPRGIITIAESMKGETDFHVWKDALAQLLKCCFDILGPSDDKNNGYSLLQMCFLYCYLHQEIDRNNLIKSFILWVFPEIGESGEALFEHGRYILDKLAKAHLLEDNEHVKMHDLVREMALELIEGKTKAIVEHYSLQEIPIIDLEKMSLMDNSTTIPDGVSPNHSTALLDSNCLQLLPKLTCLLHYSLCILDLSGTNIMKLPDSLSKFVNLKGLILKGCQKLVYVPWLGDLKELRKLDFTLTALQKVPQGMKQLGNLEFLSLDKAYQLEMLPRGLLLNFPHLQHLHLPYHIDVSGEEVARLTHLQEFRGRVKDANNFFKLIRSRIGLAYSVEVRSGFPCYRLDDFKAYNQLILSRYNFEEAKAEDRALLKQGVIRHLKLHACEGHISCLVEALLLMSYPWLIESLEVYSCEKIERLSRGGQFLGLKGAGAVASTSVSPPPAQVIFSSLKQLEIFRCNNMKRLGLSASELPNLEKITVAYCEGIEHVIEADEGQGKASVASLPKLRCLFLEDLPKLKSFCSATMVCSSLEVISMWGCQSLMKLPLVFNPSDYGSPPLALRSIWISKVEKEWWQKLELGHPTYHGLLQPFISF